MKKYLFHGLIIILILFIAGCGFSKKHKDEDYSLKDPAQTKMKCKIGGGYSPLGYVEIIIWGNGQTECEFSYNFKFHERKSRDNFEKDFEKYKDQFTLTQEEVLLFLDHFRKSKFFSMPEIKSGVITDTHGVVLSLQVGQNFREMNFIWPDDDTPMEDLLSLFMKIFEQELAIKRLQDENPDEIARINPERIFNPNRIKPSLLKAIKKENNLVKILCADLAFKLYDPVAEKEIREEILQTLLTFLREDILDDEQLLRLLSSSQIITVVGQQPVEEAISRAFRHKITTIKSIDVEIEDIKTIFSSKESENSHQIISKIIIEGKVARFIDVTEFRDLLQQTLPQRLKRTYILWADWIERPEPKRLKIPISDANIIKNPDNKRLVKFAIEIETCY